MNNSQMLETEIRSILTMGIARMESFGAHVLPLSSGGPQDEVDRQLRLFWAYGTIQAALMDLTVAKPPAPAPALGPEGAVLPPPIPEETSYEGLDWFHRDVSQAAPLGFQERNLAEFPLDDSEDSIDTDRQLRVIENLRAPSNSSSSVTLNVLPPPKTNDPTGPCQNCLSHKPEIVCYDCGGGAFCNHECWCNAHLIHDKHECVKIEKPQPAAHLLAFVTRGKLPLGSAREQFFFDRCGDDSDRSILSAIYRHLYTQNGLNAFQLHEWKQNNSLYKNIVQTFNTHPERVPSTFAHWLREHALVFAGEDTSDFLLPRLFRSKIKKFSQAQADRKKRQKEKRKEMKLIRAGILPG